MLENLIFTLNAIAPIFLIVFLGIILKRIDIIDDRFIDVSSRLVFTFTLPAMIFLKVSETPLHEVLDLETVVYIYASFGFIFLILQFAANRFIELDDDKGVFVQGSFRGNFAILGLAIIAELFGDDGLARAAILMVFIVPLNNILSVITLSIPLQEKRGLDLLRVTGSILKNPLVLAIFAGIPFAYFQWHIPIIFQKAGGQLAAISLPLALIGIGGALRFGRLRENPQLALWATSIKLLIIPVLLTGGAIALALDREMIGILFVLFAAPTAVVSFIMANAMGRNERLAANIVLLTTILSAITLSCGILLLKWWELL